MLRYEEVPLIPNSPKSMQREILTRVCITGFERKYSGNGDAYGWPQRISPAVRWHGHVGSSHNSFFDRVRTGIVSYLVYECLHSMYSLLVLQHGYSEVNREVRACYIATFTKVSGLYPEICDALLSAFQPLGRGNNGYIREQHVPRSGIQIYQLSMVQGTRPAVKSNDTKLLQPHSALRRRRATAAARETSSIRR